MKTQKTVEAAMFAMLNSLKEEVEFYARHMPPEGHTTKLANLTNRFVDIYNMDRLQLARWIRFAPAGHSDFTTPLLSDLIFARFEAMGGWDPELSKAVGL